MPASRTCCRQRTHVEGIFGNVKSAKTSDLQRGWIFIVGMRLRRWPGRNSWFPWRMPAGTATDSRRSQRRARPSRMLAARLHHLSRCPPLHQSRVKRVDGAVEPARMPPSPGAVLLDRPVLSIYRWASDCWESLRVRDSGEVSVLCGKFQIVCQGSGGYPSVRDLGGLPYGVAGSPAPCA